MAFRDVAPARYDPDTARTAAHNAVRFLRGDTSGLLDSKWLARHSHIDDLNFKQRAKQTWRFAPMLHRDFTISVVREPGGRYLLNTDVVQFESRKSSTFKLVPTAILRPNFIPSESGGKIVVMEPIYRFSEDEQEAYGLNRADISDDDFKARRPSPATFYGEARNTLAAMNRPPAS